MFLKFDMRHGHKSHSDMGHVHFLNSTGYMGINKRQRHATFPKIDRRHGHPTSSAPLSFLCRLCRATSASSYRHNDAQQRVLGYDHCNWSGITVHSDTYSIGI